MICDMHARLLAQAEAPIKRAIQRAEEGVASHVLKDGRRVTCKIKAPTIKGKRLFPQWFIDGIPVDGTIAKVALSNG